MEFRMPKGEMMTLKKGRSVLSVDCREGVLWVTQEGDERDHLLREGSSFRSRGGGTVVVTALSDAGLTVGADSRGR